MNKRLYIVYALVLGSVFFLLRSLEWQYLVLDLPLEILLGTVALVFLVVGIWLSRKFFSQHKEQAHLESGLKEPVSDKAFNINSENLAVSGISKRELEVLSLIAEGKSNDEIAEQLHLSLPTIKSHASRIFEKLEVKRRTQAVEKARKLSLIP